MSNRFIQFRQRAIDWLNSDRDFNAGILLLEESHFKPGVVAKLKRHGVNGPEAKKRLKFLINELIKAWAMSEQELADDAPELGVSSGLDLETQEGHSDQDALSLVDAYKALDNNEYQYPETVEQLIRRYADAYKQRDILHKRWPKCRRIMMRRQLRHARNSPIRLPPFPMKWSSCILNMQHIPKG